MFVFILIHVDFIFCFLGYKFWIILIFFCFFPLNFFCIVFKDSFFLKHSEILLVVLSFLFSFFFKLWLLVKYPTGLRQVCLFVFLFVQTIFLIFILSFDYFQNQPAGRYSSCIRKPSISFIVPFFYSPHFIRILLNGSYWFSIISNILWLYFILFFEIKDFFDSIFCSFNFSFETTYFYYNLNWFNR